MILMICSSVGDSHSPEQQVPLSVSCVTTTTTRTLQATSTIPCFFRPVRDSIEGTTDTEDTSDMTSDMSDNSNTMSSAPNCHTPMKQSPEHV